MSKRETKPSKPREDVPEATSVKGGTAARKTPMGIEPEKKPKSKKKAAAKSAPDKE